MPSTSDKNVMRHKTAKTFHKNVMGHKTAKTFHKNVMGHKTARNFSKDTTGFSFWDPPGTGAGSYRACTRICPTNFSL